MSEPISEAFTLIVALAEALGVRRINGLDGCWTQSVDATWWVALNGHAEQCAAKTPDGFAIDVPPYHASLMYNGFPAGIIGPRGGIIAAGSCANEDTFCAALQAAIERARS